MGLCLYRDATFHCGVDTNNGTEALNKALKYSYLPRHHSLTLSQVAALPDAFQKYPFQNFKQTAFNRICNDFVPSYLHGRPRQVILHCLDRKSSSHKFQEDDIVTVSGKAGEFTVQGKKRVHTVDFGTSSGMPSCTCLDWTKNQLPCKHFFAVF